MKRMIKKVSLSAVALLMFTSTALAAGKTEGTQSAGFSWDRVIDAIIQVESKGNPNAVSGNSVGAMQITPIAVKDCNYILQQRKSKKRCTLADRYSVAKSKEMFLLIMSRYNPTNDIEKGIRIWNGGCNYSVRATNGYYKKVMREMK